ncbi:MAG: copper ion binding protein [Clostridiales bacterium]|jgi:copper chaperone|nr:copper ion binding protein [Clostridiales bacterium]
MTVKTVLKVDGMSCEHCVKAVEGAVMALSAESVSVDLAEGTVAVEHDPERVPVESIKEAIDDQGYEVIS